MLSHVQSIHDQGFAIIPECLAEGTVESLRTCLGNAVHAQRNLLEIFAVRDLALSKPVRQLVTAVLGENCFAVRGLFLNKTPDSNWKVAWHQDRTIAVRERKDARHFGPWSIKAGVPHVQPPASVMANMLAIRLHLDESHSGNGPLRVIPGSHNAGCLTADEIEAWKERPSVTCIVPKGGALLIRPLLVHASSSCAMPQPRRVVHLEFALDDLPDGLEWHDRVAAASPTAA
ncbi:MAG TPA: phytanoyl-CoA dioxygenase family protein [Terriglobales bacterium]|nr:phytanoyl-CoA dioxygenase family protein [Terriglobales bacterium]